MLKWFREHLLEITLFFLMILLFLLVATFGIGWECLLEGTNCPPPSNLTG